MRFVLFRFVSNLKSINRSINRSIRGVGAIAFESNQQFHGYTAVTIAGTAYCYRGIPTSVVLIQLVSFRNPGAFLFLRINQAPTAPEGTFNLMVTQGGCLVVGTYGAVSFAQG